MSQFADNLRNIRKAKGLTQDELSERAGLSAKHIGEIERGKVSPTLEAIEKLANGLRVDLLVLIGDDASRMATRDVRAEIGQVLDRLDGTQLRAVLRVVRLTVKS